uniref:DUF883 domain-containing protein n=1 Tax=Ningiella ruwaisensis TaxID=2364274 RepID=UPI00109F9353|nr:DUF883 domain-containing protein [Ningiella ruwaisensis]
MANSQTQPKNVARTSKVAPSSESTHPLADKVKDTLHHSVDALSEKAAAAEQGLRDSATKGSENFSKQKQQVESKWNNSSIRQYAVENPVKTAGIAFAAGALLASLLRKD